MGKRGPQPGSVTKPEGSGRKAGVPNKITAECKAFAREFGPAAIEKAAKMAGLVVKDGKAEGQAASEAVQISAINTILDRAYGKAAQPVGGGDGTEAIRHLFGWLPSD